MQHSEGRSGGGFLNNSSCLGVSRNLSVTGNLGGPETVSAGPDFGRARSAGATSDVKEKQVNIPALAWGVMGDLNAYPKLVTQLGTARGIIPPCYGRDCSG